MKILAAFCIAFFASLSAHASWHFNENGGFGIYQPEGWSARVKGRSSRLLGPAKDFARSDLFLGSDWVDSVVSLPDLERYVREQNPHALRPVRISGLDGFRVGTEEEGVIYLLRSPKNVIVIEFHLRGSAPQREEGKIMLTSISVRIKPIENFFGTN